MAGTSGNSRNWWLRSLWIVFGIIVGVVVLAYLAMQTLSASG